MLNVGVQLKDGNHADWAVDWVVSLKLLFLTLLLQGHHGECAAITITPTNSQLSGGGGFRGGPRRSEGGGRFGPPGGGRFG